MSKVRTVRTAMRLDFANARHDTGCDWLSWIGQPMLYDGDLFVRRDGLSIEELIQLQKEERVTELDMMRLNDRLIAFDKITAPKPLNMDIKYNM